MAARLGIGHEDLARVQPLVTSVSISGFGDSGPLSDRPGYDPVVQALSGVMRTQGGPSDADSPAFISIPVNDVFAAGLGALGAVASMYATPSVGTGQHVSVTLCAAACLVQVVQLTQIAGTSAPSLGGRDYPGPAQGDRLYPCADGWVRLQAPEGTSDAELERAGLAESVVAALSVSEVVRRAGLAAVPAVRARKVQELVIDDGLIRRGLLVVTRTDDTGAVTDIGPGRWLEIPGLSRPSPGPAPQADEHASEVWSEVGIAVNPHAKSPKNPTWPERHVRRETAMMEKPR